MIIHSGQDPNRKMPQKRGPKKIMGNVEDLAEIWDILDTCYEKPEKYMAGL
jgi:hypothetical protein